MTAQIFNFDPNWRKEAGVRDDAVKFTVDDTFSSSIVLTVSAVLPNGQRWLRSKWVERYALLPLNWRLKRARKALLREYRDMCEAVE